MESSVDVPSFFTKMSKPEELGFIEFVIFPALQ